MHYDLGVEVMAQHFEMALIPFRAFMGTRDIFWRGLVETPISSSHDTLFLANPPIALLHPKN